MPARGTLHVREGVELPLTEIVLRTSRSSGPGGEHANVTASRVEAVLDVWLTTGLSHEQKVRVAERLGPQVTATAQDTRSQLRNRELALERLAGRLAAALAPERTRRPTRPTRASGRRRIVAKRQRADTKQGRRPPSVEDDG